VEAEVILPDGTGEYFINEVRSVAGEGESLINPVKSGKYHIEYQVV